MPLRGIKALEFVGLAPGPFCGKVLADFGASVTRIDKVYNNPIECLNEGKRTLILNIKNPQSQDLIKQLCKQYDVLIDPYRPGVMEKYNLGPSHLMTENPKLIYARLTGFGQYGPLSSRAGHDINYIGISGVLSFLGRKHENPLPPINLLADFAGGGLLCAFGICLALLERKTSGKGQIVDSSMVEGCAYIASWLMKSQQLPFWGQPRGENILDSGTFYYDTYKTKDGKYMSVGALESQFYEQFVRALGLPDLPQSADNEVAKKQVAEAFLSKTQKEWSDIFEGVDACVFPIVDWRDVHKHPHNMDRQSFATLENGQIAPNPAPKLSRTPGFLRPAVKSGEVYESATQILKEIGKTDDDIARMHRDGIITLPSKGKL